MAKIHIQTKLDKQNKNEREQRIKDRKSDVLDKPTNKDLFEYLNDTNDRISELYDIIKKMSKDSLK